MSLIYFKTKKMKKFISIPLYILLIGVLITYTSCGEDDTEGTEEEAVALTQSKDVTLTIPNKDKVEITYSGTKGDVIKLYTPKITLTEPAREILAVLDGPSSLATVQTAATADNDTTYIKITGVGTEELKFTWKFEEVKEEVDVNNDQIKDNITYKAISTTATINLKVVGLSPTAFTITSPADKSKDIGPQPTIIWSASTDPEGGEVTYAVYLDGVQKATDLKKTEYTFAEAIGFAKTVIVKVVTTTSTGATAEATSSFSTVGITPQTVSRDVVLTIPNESIVKKTQRDSLANTIKIYTPKIVLTNPPKEILARLVGNPSHAQLVQASTSSNDTTTLKLTSKGTEDLEFKWSFDKTEVKEDVNGDFINDNVTYNATDTVVKIPLIVGNPLAPLPFRITSPTAGSTLTTLTPTIKWEKSDPRLPLLNIKYRVTITSSASSTILASNLTDLEFKVRDGSLTKNTDYEIVVSATDQFNSPKFVFTDVKISVRTGDVNAPPKKPIILSPTSVTTRKPTLEWSVVGAPVRDTDGGNVTYDIYLDTNDPPTTKIATGVDAFTYATTNLLALSTTYYWKVVANDGEDTTESDIEDFRTPTNSTPSNPTLTAPGGGATAVTTTPTLTWSASTDLDGDAITYDVFLGKGAPSSLGAIPVATGLSSTSYTPSTPLDANTQYSWRVQSSDGKGGFGSSPTFSFTTAAASSAVYYDPDAKAVFDSYCISCHGSTNANGGRRFHTFSDASSGANRALARMQAGTMPPSGKLSDDKINTIKEWIDGGLLEKE